MIYEKITTGTWDSERDIPMCPGKGAFEVEYRGKVCFVVDGKFHREDGPAVIYANGATLYYQNGKKHREDGPAISANGIIRYYLFGFHYYKETWEPLATQLRIKGEIL